MTKKESSNALDNAVRNVGNSSVVDGVKSPAEKQSECLGSILDKSITATETEIASAINGRLEYCDHPEKVTLADGQDPNNREGEASVGQGSTVKQDELSRKKKENGLKRMSGIATQFLNPSSSPINVKLKKKFSLRKRLSEGNLFKKLTRGIFLRGDKSPPESSDQTLTTTNDEKVPSIDTTDEKCKEEVNLEDKNEIVKEENELPDVKKKPLVNEVVNYIPKLGEKVVKAHTPERSAMDTPEARLAAVMTNEMKNNSKYIQIKERSYTNKTVDPSREWRTDSVYAYEESLKQSFAKYCKSLDPVKQNDNSSTNDHKEPSTKDPDDKGSDHKNHSNLSKRDAEDKVGGQDDHSELLKKKIDDKPGDRKDHSEISKKKTGYKAGSLNNHSDLSKKETDDRVAGRDHTLRVEVADGNATQPIDHIKEYEDSRVRYDESLNKALARYYDTQSAESSSGISHDRAISTDETLHSDDQCFSHISYYNSLKKVAEEYKYKSLESIDSDQRPSKSAVSHNQSHPDVSQVSSYNSAHATAPSQLHDEGDNRTGRISKHDQLMKKHLNEYSESTNTEVNGKKEKTDVLNSDCSSKLCEPLSEHSEGKTSGLKNYLKFPFLEATQSIVSEFSSNKSHSKTSSSNIDTITSGLEKLDDEDLKGISSGSASLMQ